MLRRVAWWRPPTRLIQAENTRFRRHLIGDLLEMRIGPGRGGQLDARDSAVDRTADLGGLLTFLAPYLELRLSQAAAPRPPAVRGRAERPALSRS